MIKVDKKYEPVVRKWQQELRSGNYEQTTDELVQGEPGNMAFCCLGVYCEMKGKKSFKGYTDITDFFGVFSKEFDDEDLLFKDFLQIRLIEYFIDEDYYIRNIENAFITLNDTLGFSFNQIADWIDTNITFEL